MHDKLKHVLVIYWEMQEKYFYEEYYDENAISKD